MKTTTTRYGNLLMLSTLQFEGHFREYFVRHARKVVALYLLPRGGRVKNFIEVYRHGHYIERKELISPKNIFLSYMFYYLDYLYILVRYFPVGERLYFINFLPFFFFFNSIIRLLWKIEFVYWIGDYWPMESWYTKVFRFFTYYYHDRAKYTIYLSDRINHVMNRGTTVHTLTKRTVMWGINPPKITTQKSIRGPVTLCLVGVLVEWQGIDLLLSVLAEDPTLRLKLIGTGKPTLMERYKQLIVRYGIESRVYFPNKFLYGKTLQRTIAGSHIGIALYQVDSNTVTYYADPAKIKQYAEFGLPIIMTDAAEIAVYIKKFKAGIVVKRDKRHILWAIHRIRDNYDKYLRGLQQFNEHFNYRSYYAKAFRFLEK